MKGYCSRPGCTYYAVVADGDGERLCWTHAAQAGIPTDAGSVIERKIRLRAVREALRK